MRYFRISPDAAYEAVRLQLDAAWGHPTPDGSTVTCVDPAAVAPHDAQGRVLLAVLPEFCEYEAVAAMLPQLFASGVVEEITEAAYQAVLNAAVEVLPWADAVALLPPDPPMPA
jgi:hypothetical protein